MPSWLKSFRVVLPLLGHRNWVVVADAAYPLQIAPGIQTVVARERLPQVLGKVLGELRRARHVRPIINLDEELRHLSDTIAPGAAKLRRQVDSACKGFSVRSLPHEELIARLDEAGSRFKILVIKCAERIPYTSVFIELECGYWHAGAEKALRAGMAGPEVT